MFRVISVIFLVMITIGVSAQIGNRNQLSSVSNRFEENVNDTLVNRGEIKVEIQGETSYRDYKVISFKRDTTFMDTTMSVQTFYDFNYTRTDQSGSMPFPNQGQTFNPLSFNVQPDEIFPTLGARSKNVAYFEREDIKYYQVPTPTTELLYRTGMEQGQVAQGLFTFNASEQFNASIDFKGIRSLGHYRNSLSDHGNFIVTSNYNTKNQRYYIRAHIAAQDIINDENGGLTDQSLEYFESGASDFKDRARVVTNFTDAESILRGNRYYFDHFYKLWQEKDSVADRKFSYLTIGHVLDYERKHFEYKQESASPIFGPAFTSGIEDGNKETQFYNEIYAKLKAPFVLGDFKVSISNLSYDYGYNRVIIEPEGIINNKLSGNAIAVGADWNTDLKRFNLQGKASSIVGGNLEGYSLKGGATFQLDSLSMAYASAYTNNRSPNFNFLLFQSDYKEYNWQNNFSNEQITGLEFGIRSKKWLDANFTLNNIDNYTFFSSLNGEQATPQQSAESIQYLKVELRKEFRLGKFALDNSFIYQNTSDFEVMPMPDFITRNTLYFSDHIFRGDPLYLQTGITFNYFSDFFMQKYNPVLGEFSTQNEQKYGGFPMFDFFINAQIQRTRLYLLFEHFNSDLTGYNYYSAPGVPYRDFTVRFGLVWTIFI